VTYPIYLGSPHDPNVKVLGFSQAGLRLPDAERVVARFTGFIGAGLACFGVLFVVALWAAVKVTSSNLRREGESLRTAQLRFVADAAHELGTPLAILRGEIDIALRHERSLQEYRITLASCREEIERLSHLSENLLALATADTGQKLLHLAPCNAAATARKVHARFARLAAEKGVTFDVISPESLPWLADVLAIEQILGNLVDNALRHTPKGDRVVLKVARESDEIFFQVQDTGEGIPPAHLPLLFNRFHRVDKARSRSSGGAGLGLAIVKTLVTAHGGRVSVSSEVGRGSIFTCRFPAESVEESC
jgi:signal transduction histidine kinase